MTTLVASIFYLMGVLACLVGTWSRIFLLSHGIDHSSPLFACMGAAVLALIAGEVIRTKRIRE